VCLTYRALWRTRVGVVYWGSGGDAEEALHLDEDQNPIGKEGELVKRPNKSKTKPQNHIVIRKLGTGSLSEGEKN